MECNLVVRRQRDCVYFRDVRHPDLGGWHVSSKNELSVVSADPARNILRRYSLSHGHHCKGIVARALLHEHNRIDFTSDVAWFCVSNMNMCKNNSGVYTSPCISLLLPRKRSTGLNNSSLNISESASNRGRWLGSPHLLRNQISKAARPRGSSWPSVNSKITAIYSKIWQSRGRGIISSGYLPT